MILPAGLLVIVVSKAWDRYRENRWRRIIQAALLPITAGLILASAGILMRQADTGVLTALITLVSAGLHLARARASALAARRRRAAWSAGRIGKEAAF